MKDKIVIIIGHRLQTMHWASKLYVLKQGIIIQQGSYEELVAVDGYFKDLVASGLGQFSSAIEEELKAGKYSTAQHIAAMDETLKQACIIDAKKQEVITDAVTKSSTLDKHDVKIQKMGLQGWKLLFAVLSPAKWSFSVSLDIYIPHGLHECRFVNSFILVISVGSVTTRSYLFKSCHRRGSFLWC